MYTFMISQALKSWLKVVKIYDSLWNGSAFCLFINTPTSTPIHQPNLPPPNHTHAPHEYIQWVKRFSRNVYRHGESETKRRGNWWIYCMPACNDVQKTHIFKNGYKERQSIIFILRFGFQTVPLPSLVNDGHLKSSTTPFPRLFDSGLNSAHLWNLSPVLG